VRCPSCATAGTCTTPTIRHAERILKAAAYTYVAQSLMSLLNIWAWLRFLRR
jgi:uncharacterized protein